VRFRRSNPLLSLWLSGANAVLGTARGQMSAAMQRQANAVVSEAARQATRQWLALWTAPVAPVPGARTSHRPPRATAHALAGKRATAVARHPSSLECHAVQPPSPSAQPIPRARIRARR